MINDVSLNKFSKYALVILEDGFRKRFIEDAIRKAGSMRELGRIMGYTGKASNWNVKQILYGKQGIPLFRLERLCEFMNISFVDVKKYVKEIKTRKFKFITPNL